MATCATTGKAKDARFEEVDFNLYKPGAKSTAFATSEGRLNLWIRCFIKRYCKHLNHECNDYRVTWQEQDSAGDPNRCDRIILHLYALEGGKEQHIVAITVYISTGTVFIQGKWFQNFGMVEFPLLLDIINQMSKSNPMDDVNDLCKATIPNFLKQDLIPAPGITVRKEDEYEENDLTDKNEEENDVKNTSDNTPEAEHPAEFHKTLEDDVKDVEPEPLRYTPSRLHTFTALRTTVANMESKHTEFKVEITQSLHAINTAVAEGESKTKDILCQLDNTLKLRIKNLEEEISEVRNSETKMLAEITKLASTVKKLQEQLTSVQKKNDSLLEEQEMMKIEMESIKVARQQQSPCGQLPEEPMTPQEANFNQSTLDQQRDSITSPVPLSNKFEILRDGSDEDVEIKVSSRQSDRSDSNSNQQERNLPITHLVGNQQCTVEAEEPLRLDDTTRQQKPQTTPNTRNQQQRTEKANAVILCDSNGKYLNLKKLCPDRNTSYFRCHTIKQGTEIIDSSQFDSPQIILLHTGTNDLEKTSSVNQLTVEITELIKTTAKKYPTSKVLYSTLLPRRDVSNDEISKINTQIEKRCSHLANVHLIDHTNLMQQNVLHDLKHLNQLGVKLFAKNLKTVIYGRRQTTQRNRNARETSIRENSSARKFMAPLKQEPRPSPVTVFQRPSSKIMDSTMPPSPQEYMQSRSSYATVLQRPPPQMMDPPPQRTSTTSETQEQTNQGGQLMNISIPMKMLPLIQFFF